MKITWVNHASFIVECHGISLIVDPWIEGRVFNESWEHISNTVLTYDQFDKITHIWFSHEHPDHFYPPNLKKIPKNIREKITVLYQKTEDGKVINFCKNLGFKVLEMIPWQPLFLTPQIKLLNASVSNDSDSWLYFESNDGSFLNLNDCVFNKKEDLVEIKNKIGQVDLLFTQFSYANWVGNKDDFQLKQKSALEKLSEIKSHIDVFKPKYTIPFASFVWFCNIDNFHMNAYVNKIDAVTKFIELNHSIPIVMYPGNVWILNDKWDNHAPINAYLSDFESKRNNHNLVNFEEVSFQKLWEAAENYRIRHLKKNNRNKLLSYKPFKAFLTDANYCVSFSYRNGLKMIENDQYANADISFASQNLKYCFDFDWGWSTIMVAGTFEKPSNGNFQNVAEYQWISNLNNVGKVMPGLWKRLLMKFKS
jgi:hypothetical protein